MMEDVSGKSLTEGDKVATMIDGYTCQLEICEVIGFTPQKVKLSHHVDCQKAKTYTKYPKQVCKI